MARLDRLGGAKEVAQIGAAIGREFSHALLASVVLEPEAELGSALDRLIAAGLLFRQGVPPQATYLFKHALVQDAAYETLLRASRVHLHARIASAIETGFPQLAEAEPESLARHHIEAGNMGRGLDCLLVAGRKALEQSAFAEAKTLLRSAIELVATALDVPEIQSRELEAQILLGNVLMATVGYGADEVGSVYKRAHSLTLRLGNRERELPVLYGLWAHGYSRLELIRCLELATQLLEVAREIGNRVAEMTARRLSAFTLLPLGRIKDALVDCEVAMTLYQPEQDRHLAFEYAQDPYVALSMVKVWCLTTLGATDRALQVAIDSVALARQLKHNHTLAYALGWALSRAYMWRRDAEGAMASAEECITISREHGFPVLLAAALIVRAWALAAIGDGERAAEAINEAWSAYESAGALLQRPMVCAILAEAQIHLGCLDIADSYLDDGLSASQASAHIWYTPELYRLKAQVARQRGAIPHDETKAWLRKANELAEILEAPLWQLRAARDLFEQQVEAGDFISAREMLLAIHARFTEGFDTLDLKEAKALLDELAL